MFRALADRPDFPNQLFWVGFRDEQPSADVKAALLDAGKDVHWISGYDPDTFLLQLASRLGCFPPGFFAKPFTHLLECFGSLAGFRLRGRIRTSTGRRAPRLDLWGDRYIRGGARGCPGRQRPACAG